MKEGIFCHFLFMIFISLVHSWEKKALQCWQCASVPGGFFTTVWKKDIFTIQILREINYYKIRALFVKEDCCINLEKVNE